MKTAEMIEPEIQTISGENVIQIPDGLLGFEQFKKYVLLAQPQEAPFMWLRRSDWSWTSEPTKDLRLP